MTYGVLPVSADAHTRRGAAPERGGLDPLLLACEEDHLEIVNALLTSAKTDASTLLETISPLTVSICCQFLDSSLYMRVVSI